MSAERAYTTAARRALAAATDNWRDRAVCARPGPDLWYHPAIDTTGTSWHVKRARQTAVAAAVAVCSACPARAECLDYAIATDQPGGIWGGMTAAERTAERNRRTTP